MAFYFPEKKIKHDGACSVNGQPGTVQESAVAKRPFLDQEDANLPEKAAQGAEEEIKNQPGYEIHCVSLPRAAELVEIRFVFLFFHGNSVPVKIGFMQWAERGVFFLTGL